MIKAAKNILAFVFEEVLEFFMKSEQTNGIAFAFV